MAKARSRTLPPLVVRYGRRMKPNRTYTAKVTWQGPPPKLGEDAPDFRVRLIAPGAQVVPTERPMDPNKSNASALFYVTPLARGKLRGERLEVLVDGEKIQEIALPSKAYSQRRSWILLFLAFFIPWFLINHVQGTYETILHENPWYYQIQTKTPLDYLRTEKILSKKLNMPPEREVELWRTLEITYNQFYQILSDDWIPKRFVSELQREVPPDDGENQEEDGPAPNADGNDKQAQANAGGVGDRLVLAIQQPPVGGGDEPAERAVPVPAYRGNRDLEEGYQLYLPFWIGVIFFLWSILCFWFRRPKYAKRRGKPIKLAILEE